MKTTWLYYLLVSFCVLKVSTSAVSADLGSPSTRLSPVILIPGDGGSQIEAKWDTDTVPHLQCSKRQKDWTSLYISLEELSPPFFECFVDRIKLVFNETLGRWQNTPGVQTRVPGWGNTSTVEFLDPSVGVISEIDYFNKMCDFLTGVGYVRGVSLRASPYDWRLDARSNPAFFPRLRALVEDTYARNDNTPVTLVSHSMGGLYAQYFLQHQEARWKRRYVHAWVPIAGPFGGAAKLVQALSSGNNMGIPLAPPLQARAVERNPACAWLLPRPGGPFWAREEVLAATPRRNYTAFEIEDFLRDAGWAAGPAVYNRTRGQVDPRAAPGVPTHCLYGTGVATDESYEWEDQAGFPDQVPRAVTSMHGDGTLNARSALACEQWKGEQKQNVTVQWFEGVSHQELVKVPSVFNALEAIVRVKQYRGHKSLDSRKIRVENI